MLIKYHNALKINNVETVFQDFTLTPQKWNQYNLYNGHKLIDEENQAIFIDSKSLKIRLKSSWFGEYPLFYYIDNNYVFISYSIPHILLELYKENINIEIDDIAFYQSMIFDFPLRHRTLWKSINKLVSGYTVEINLVQKTHHIIDKFILPFHNGNSTNHVSIRNNAVDILNSLLKNYKDIKTQHIICSLSGGYDSRLLACLLKRNNFSFDAIVVGPPESSEIRVSNKISNLLEIHTRHLDLKNMYYKKFGDEVTFLTGGLSNHRHCHLYSCFKKNKIFNNFILHGYLGDTYSGTHQSKNSLFLNMKIDDSIRAFINEKLRSKHIWQILDPDKKEEILYDLNLIMEDNCLKNLPCYFTDYIHNVDRQFSLISNVFCLLEKFGELIRPFASKDYALFFNSLPYQYKDNRILYIKTCKLLFPREFSIGNEVSVYRNNNFLSKIEKYISTFSSAFTLFSLLTFKGKIVFRSSKQCERHKEILLTDLHANFSKSIDYISRYLNVNLDFYKGIGLRNRKEKIGQYRIVSMYYMLNLLNNKQNISQKFQTHKIF